MDKDRQIDIMGIVNLTDDSFYAGSRCSDVAAALKRVGKMVEEGATIIDIGACSTRPGSLPAGPEEEWDRLKEVLPAVRSAYPGVDISVDTYRASVVSRAYDLIGEFIINDISAGEDDPMMLPAAGRLGLRYIAMHKRGTPDIMQSLTDYDDVTEEVFRYFLDFSIKAREYGIRDWIADPGFGFAKTTEQNFELLRNLGRLSELPEGNRILVGVSRKSMIYRFLDITPEDSLPATQAVHMKALENGADILRVHDVAEAVRTVSLYRALA